MRRPESSLEEHHIQQRSKPLPKEPIDFVIHGIMEFLCEIGRKRIVIRSDNEPAVKALGQAVALHREDETVIEEIPVKSSKSIGCSEHDHFLVNSWILRHSVSLVIRLCVGRDGYTSFQTYKGRIYNGEVCVISLNAFCSRFRLRRRSWMTGPVLVSGLGRPRGVMTT